MNSAIQGIRSDAIFDLTHGLIKWIIVKSHERSERGQQWQREHRVLTKYWEDKHIAAMGSAGPLAVAVTYHVGPVWRAQVSVQPIGGTSIVFAVEVNVDTFETKCPCRRREEFGDLCWHTLSLIMSEGLHPNDPNWYNESFRVSTYVAMYSVETPQITTSADRLKMSMLLPPEHKRGKGRPRTRRIESNANTPTPRICGACGQAGHMSKACPSPSTRFRVEKNWKKAVSYAEQLCALGSNDV
jgi:hypothetical protein